METSRLITYVSDNTAVGIHRAGYNGIASLIPRHIGNNVFVPTYSGLNYEISWVANLQQTQDQRYEPRRAPMEVVEADDSHVCLHQAPTDFKGIEASITFHLEEPYYIHQTVLMMFHKVFESPMTFRSLWASYLHIPPDRHLYLKLNDAMGDLDGWVGVTKEDHGVEDHIVRPLPPEEISVEDHRKAMESGSMLERYKRIDGPLAFYYGLYHDDAFIMMFKEPQQVRFGYSPCGGGKEPVWSPAWDYFLHLDDVEVGKSYEWNICLVYKSYVSRCDILQEVERYFNSKS
ncbi:MAG: hypothetical protein HY709_03230 [Candidatus Latescibacteria bacterium]|nr:hypothetical protein [Candidatus Latescibacterota bacterium]